MNDVTRLDAELLELYTSVEQRLLELFGSDIHGSITTFDVRLSTPLSWRDGRLLIFGKSPPDATLLERITAAHQMPAFLGVLHGRQLKLLEQIQSAIDSLREFVTDES